MDAAIFWFIVQLNATSAPFLHWVEYALNPTPIVLPF